MSDGRLPLAFGAAAALDAVERKRTALVATGAGATQGFALLRHADAAAMAQAGACRCCRVPSDLVTVLRQLLIDRARGAVDFAAVLVEGEEAMLARLAADAGADPVVAARYAIAAAPLRRR